MGGGGQIEYSAGVTEQIDFSEMDGYVVTLTANATVKFVVHEKGKTTALKVVQDAGVAYTLTWDSAILFPTGVSNATPAAAKYRLLLFYDDGTNWLCISSVTDG